MLTLEEKKRKIEETKQTEIMQSILTSMDIAINNDDCYSHREFTLQDLHEELKEYFGED